MIGVKFSNSNANYAHYSRKVSEMSIIWIQYIIQKYLIIKKIWELIKEYYDKAEEMQKKKKTILKVKRTKYLEFWKPRLKALKEDTDEKFNRLYIRNYKVKQTLM